MTKQTLRQLEKTHLMLQSTGTDFCLSSGDFIKPSQKSCEAEVEQDNLAESSAQGGDKEDHF